MRIHVSSLIAVLCVAVAWWGCDDGNGTTEPTANMSPTAIATGDSVVLPGTTISLFGSGIDPDGEIVLYEWLIEGEQAFMSVSNGDTSVTAPAVFDDDFVCVLRVTDNGGATGLDTLHVLVSEDLTRNRPPVAFAGPQQVVLPGSNITVSGSGQDNDGTIVLCEWFFKGSSGFVPVTDGDTTIVAPGHFDTDYQCILRVTDDGGKVGLDTLRVIVSWLRSPNGGEVFRIGDSMHVRMLPSEELANVKLIIYTDDDYLNLSLPGLGGGILLMGEPVYSFVIPDSLTDAVYGRVSLVSDSCRIRVGRYSQPSHYVESAEYFSIIP
jgi:hypothetical protein